MTTKEKMKDIINDAVAEDEIFGNEIYDIIYAWRRAIDDKLDSMNKKELQVLYEKAKEILKDKR
jgi:hypothetical protein